MRKLYKQLQAGDIIININDEIIKVDSGIVDVFTDGTYTLKKDGHLMYVDKDAILAAQASHNQIIDLTDLIT